jgi:hypothetical protein
MLQLSFVPQVSYVKVPKSKRLNKPQGTFALVRYGLQPATTASNQLTRRRIAAGTFDDAKYGRGLHIRTRATKMHWSLDAQLYARPMDSITASHDSRRIDGFILAGT